MNGNTVLYVGIGFAVGACIGAGVTYVLTKRKCDEMTQRAIDEMTEYYKEKEPKKIEKKEEETEFVRKDKPNISEITSIVNSDSDNNNRRTHYSFIDDTAIGTLKKKLQDEIEEKKKQEEKTIKIISETEEMSYESVGYEPVDYTFDSDTGTWMDYGATACDIDDLPFDPGIVEWIDDKCSLVDHENHALYLLERVM